MRTRVNPTTAKLILPRNLDGEIVATVRAIERVLRAEGRDLHDIAAAISPPQHVAPATAHHSAPDYRSVLLVCFAHRSRLRPDELEFLRHLDWVGNPKSTDLRRLLAIHARFLGKEHAA